jgi:hypothetical protein
MSEQNLCSVKTCNVQFWVFVQNITPAVQTTFSTNPFKITGFFKFDAIKISFMHLGVLPPHFVIARV